MIFINRINNFMLMKMNINKSHCGPLFQVERSVLLGLNRLTAEDCVKKLSPGGSY